MGSVQHLETKFGDGYTLTVKIRETTTSTSTGAAKNKYVALILAELRHRISRSCQLKERHFNNVYQYELPYPSPSEPDNGAATATAGGGERFRIGDVYCLVESNKIRFSIVDYSLSQNTLDVFINFVKSTVTTAGAPAGANLPSDEDDNDNENSEDDDDQDADAEISSVADKNDNEPSLSTTTKITTLTSTTKKKTRKSPRYEFPLHDSDDLLLDLDDS